MTGGASFVRSFWSGRDDSNVRPPEPHSGALPGCATPRQDGQSIRRPGTGFGGHQPLEAGIGSFMPGGHDIRGRNGAARPHVVARHRARRRFAGESWPAGVASPKSIRCHPQGRSIDVASSAGGVFCAQTLPIRGDVAVRGNQLRCRRSHDPIAAARQRPGRSGPSGREPGPCCGRPDTDCAGHGCPDPAGDPCPDPAGDRRADSGRSDADPAGDRRPDCDPDPDGRADRDRSDSGRSDADPASAGDQPACCRCGPERRSCRLARSQGRHRSSGTPRPAGRHRSCRTPRPGRPRGLAGRHRSTGSQRRYRSDGR